MCCAAVAGDEREGPVDSEEGVLSGFCSGACGAERLPEPGDPTGGQTVLGLGRDLELVREREVNFSGTNKRHITSIKPLK